MRVWDADSGRDLEVEIRTFTGPQAEYTLIDGERYHIRGHYLTDQAPAPGGSAKAKYRSTRTTHVSAGKVAGKVERRSTPREGKAA